MHKAAWIVLASLLACDDGSIGGEDCVGASCEAKGFQIELLPVNFKEVRTQNAWPLPAPAWSLANPCGTPCAAQEPAKLFWAGSDRTWNVQRHTLPPTIELIDGAGKRSSSVLDAPPGSGAGSPVFAVGQPDGSVFMHVQWTQSNGSPAVDEMAVWAPQQAVQRTQLKSLPNAVRPLGAIRGEDGFLMFDDDLRAGMLTGSTRLLGGDGSVRWQRGNFPDSLRAVGGSAVWDASAYVLAARNEAPEATLVYALAWFAPGGVLTRGTMIADAIWRTTQLYDRGQGQFVAAGRSDIKSAGAAGGNNEGNLDIVSFSMQSAVMGWRLRRDCFFALDVLGFASDMAGNMFVSSRTGVWDQPRGLLCRLPVVGDARCYQTEPMHTLGSLVAVGPSSVVAQYDDGIARFNLD